MHFKASLPNPHPNRDLKLALARTSKTTNTNPTAAGKASTPESTSGDDGNTMQDFIDLTETDSEWERSVSGPMSYTDGPPQ
ncbi:hypothetical protein J3R83DRAFT_13402 [Lanmaoa asiatica]|nr:hypothetical protein J3R83DRAFT_13402 [Lanmaoa asiatica]